MYRIENITVNNFKNIIDTDIELSNFNVIVGTNNSGKSNFLQVIPFLNYLINGSLDKVEENMDGILFPLGIGEIAPRNEKYSDAMNIIIKYFNTDTKNIINYQIKISWGETTHHVPLTFIISYENLEYKNIHSTGKFSNIFERKETNVTFGKDFSGKKIKKTPLHASVLRFLSLIELEIKSEYKDAIDGLKSILNTPIFYFSNTELRKKRPEERLISSGVRTIAANIEQDILKLQEVKESRKILKDILKALLDIQNIEVINLANKKIKGDYLLVIEQFGILKSSRELSDGSLSLIALVTEILSSKSNIVMIEEPENSIHPKALEILIRFMQSYTDEKQFIITTHSSSLLNLVKPEDVIIARLNKKGNSQLGRVNNLKELKKKINKGYISFGDTLIHNIDEQPEEEETTY